MDYCIERIKQVLKQKDYAFFDKGIYNLNIIGIRKTKGVIENIFDDKLHLIYKDNLGWQNKVYPITTEPGIFWLKNPMYYRGTAIIVPGQYRNVYKIGYHYDYEALVQKGIFRIYVDNNRDDKIDLDPKTIEQANWYGLNFHYASAFEKAEKVDKYSAGCQVFQVLGNFLEFMKLVRESRNIYGNSFTYTLLEEKDFEP